MASKPENDCSVEVVIARDGSQAELIVPATFSRELLTDEFCKVLLRDGGVELTPEVLQAVQTLAASPPAPGESARVVVAKATQPVHGSDGRLEWAVDEQEVVEPSSDTNQRVSFYECSHYQMVKAGQVIGRIISPAQHEDGRDVRGKAIAARPGRPVELELDETVMQDARGQLIAQIEGVLVRQGKHISISQVLEVQAYVDFSTGNINFEGDILVHKGIRDCFEVRATGNIEVHGLIEAAMICCDGQLIARGGMAGRERGQVRVGSDLIGRYLDNVQGDVFGDLCVEREIINCQLTAHRDVKAPSGAVIGGQLTVGGMVEVGTIGSSAGVTTYLAVGTLPQLEASQHKLQEVMDQLSQRRDELVKEQAKLMRSDGRMSAADRERQTEIMFELQTLNQNIHRAATGLNKAEQMIEQRRKVDVRIQRKIWQNVVIDVRGTQYRMRDEIAGPIRVMLDERGEVVLSRGSTTQLLSQVAVVRGG